MMKCKHPGTKLIYTFSLDDYIPKDHFLRLVDELVDFSFVRDLVREFYSDRGAPSVDPVVIFKMSLLGYFYGISSERRLAEECRYNLAFKWFLHYDIDEIPPDHSIFSKARARYGKQAFEQFFSEIVRKCAEVGLIDGTRLFVDASLLKANASRRSLAPRDSLMELKQSPKEYIESLWRENPTDGPDSNDGDPPEPPKQRRRKTNEVMVSKTDPDAEVVYRPGVGSMLAHKIHIAVADGKDRIVTAVTTTPGAVQEHTQVPELLTRHWMVTGEKPEEVVGDAGYGIMSTYEFLDKLGISPNMPYRHARDSRRDLKHKVGFSYDAERDVYICPEGKTLYRLSTPKGAPGHVLYMVSRCACHKCPRHGVECKPKRPSIVRTERDELLRRVREYRQTTGAQASFRRRKYSVEPAFAELKTTRGVRQANLRGNWKVQIQMLVAFAAYNIKRLVKRLDERRKSQEIALSARVRRLASLVSPNLVLFFPVCHVA